MSQQYRIMQSDPTEPTWAEPLSEPECHTEHQAALDATLFRPAGAEDELVLELEAGKLRVRSPAKA